MISLIFILYQLYLYQLHDDFKHYISLFQSQEQNFCYLFSFIFIYISCPPAECNHVESPLGFQSAENKCNTFQQKLWLDLLHLNASCNVWKLLANYVIWYLMQIYLRNSNWYIRKLNRLKTLNMIWHSNFALSEQTG